jgi:3-oxoacyl-[acyl-carrier-protein] synthase III
MAGVVYSDYYLPKNVYNAFEILKMSNNENVNNNEYCEFFLSQSKLKNICIENEKSEIEIFEMLLDNFFLNDLKPKDISYIIFTKNPYSLMEGNVCIPYYLRARFEMNSATVIGMFQECATTLQAMQISCALIDSGRANNVMILSMCHVTNMEERFIGTSIVGDGAGVMVIGKQGIKCEIIAEKSTSDGRYSLYEHNKNKQKVNNMDTVKKGVELITDLLKTNGFTAKDIKMIIPQNLNFHGYYVYVKLLGIPMENMFLKNIPMGGHLADVDTIRNYTDVIREGEIMKDNLFVLYATGAIRPGFDTVYNTVLLKCK